jgi:UDP-N-acetylglucosamine:LPS N-acetylglucosamine transferase
LLIPFKHGTTASHQTLNANYLEKNGNAKVVVEYKEFSELIHNICKYKFSYLDENFTSYQIKVGNDDIFKIISESNYE